MRHELATEQVQHGVGGCRPASQCFLQGDRMWLCDSVGTATRAHTHTHTVLLLLIVVIIPI